MVGILKGIGLVRVEIALLNGVASCVASCIDLHCTTSWELTSNEGAGELEHERTVELWDPSSQTRTETAALR